MFRSALATIALLATATLAASASAANITIALENRHREELDRGFEAINAGEPAKAVKAFDKVIKAYTKEYGKQEIRCARNLEEATQVSVLAMVGPMDEIVEAAKGMKSGESKVIKDKFDKVTVLGPNWCDAIFGKAFALIDLHKSGQAEPLLARTTALAPTRGHYLNEYAELFKAKRDWARSFQLFSSAAELARKGLDASDKSIEARSLRGMGFNKIEMGELDEAEKLFKRSIEVKDSPGARSELEYIAKLRAQAKPPG